MRKSCLTCYWEKGEVDVEHKAQCTLQDKCFGLENWCPKGCLRVTDERSGRGRG
jgi:hypothetical protein